MGPVMELLTRVNPHQMRLNFFHILRMSDAAADLPLKRNSESASEVIKHLYTIGIRVISQNA